MFEYGWKKKFLRVDLTKKRVKIEDLKENLIREYIGGRGLNVKILYDEIPPGVDPLGIDNKLIVGVGPYSGTLIPGNSRFTITAKSPLSGYIGDANAGGYFGTELKYAGFDGIIVEGIAEKPLYLWIDNGKIELRDAMHLWGRTVGETQNAIESELGDPSISTAVIGPAGENLVRFACIITDIGRAAGRTGLGAVMGSKKLKAIVVRGSRGVKVAHPKELDSLIKEIYQGYHNDVTGWYEKIAKYGPSYGVLDYNNLGILPTRNYQQGTFEFIDSVSPERFYEEYIVNSKSCFSCPIGCSQYFIINKGPYAGGYGEGLETGQMEMFGSRVGNKNLDVIAQASIICDQLGLDIIDMSATIGYIMECYEKRILTKKDADGLNLEWGNRDTIIQLIHKTAYREGIGDILSQGVKRVAEMVGKGSEKYTMQIKGLTMSTRDPRGSKGWGLGYAVASRGADHCRSSIFAETNWEPNLANYILTYPADAVAIEDYRFTEKGKAELTIWYENIRAVQNCLEVCIFASAIVKLMSLELEAKVFNAVTDLNFTEKDLERIGERVINLERGFNIREGLTKSEDTLPDRFLNEEMPEGKSVGQKVKLQKMIKEYYKLRGWDKNGFPTEKKLEELNLSGVANNLRDLR